MSADEFNKWALGCVAIAAFFAGPWIQWMIANRQAKLQEGISRRQAILQEGIAKRQLADSIAGKRRDWLDGLRSDLAATIAHYTDYDEIYFEGKNVDLSPEALAEIERRADQAVMKAYESMLKIRLRLDKDVPMQAKVLDGLDELRAYFIEVHAGKEPSVDRFLAVRDGIVENAGRLLRSEWKAVLHESEQVIAVPSENE